MSTIGVPVARFRAMIVCVIKDTRESIHGLQEGRSRTAAFMSRRNLIHATHEPI
jgi:hypothetical protein